VSALPLLLPTALLIALQTCSAAEPVAVPETSQNGDSAPAESVPPVSKPEWELVREIHNEDLAEPSGLYYLQERNSVLAVDDGDGKGRPAALLELDLEGNTLQKSIIGTDLEGVCYCAENGMVYVADEHKDTVHVVALEGLKAVGSSRLDGKINGERIFKASGNGIEGIEYLPAGVGADYSRLILLNQEKPHVLLELRLADIHPDLPAEKIEPTAHWPYHPFNAGELHYDAPTGELWLVHSWINMVEILDPATMEPQRNAEIPGFAQEGVTMDADGQLWIGQDTGGIGIYRRKDGKRGL
jgi:uncharacterized protein YjiK